MLAADLIERLAARAADPKARKDARDLDQMMADSKVVTVETPFGTVAIAQGLRQGPRPVAAPAPLPAPAGPDAVAAAEARLGFALPADLRQLYGAVADGGFGPGSGLIPLAEMTAYHEELRAHPPGEGGQPWPARLLPINRYDLGCDCLDTESGAVVFWDEESLAEGPSERVWRRAFKPAAESLSAYLEAWLASPRPKSNERYVRAAEAGFPGSDAVIDLWRVKQLRVSIAMLRESPEDLETFGLPRDGWEEALCQARGLDPAIYLEMARRPAEDED